MAYIHKQIQHWNTCALFYVLHKYVVASEFTYAYVATLHLLLENLSECCCYFNLYNYAISSYVISAFLHICLGKQHFLSYHTEGDI